MKRNSLFGAAALFVAGAAIGGGAMVSQRAMASETPPVEADSVIFGSIGADGSSVQCTFTGAEAQSLMPSAAPSVDPSSATGESIVGYAVAEGGYVAETDGTLPPLPDGSVTFAVGAMTGEIVASAVDGSGSPIEMAAPREGTPEECAAMLAAFEAAP